MIFSCGFSVRLMMFSCGFSVKLMIFNCGFSVRLMMFSCGFSVKLTIFSCGFSVKLMIFSGIHYLTRIFFRFTEWKPEISGTLFRNSRIFRKNSGFYSVNRKNFRVSFRKPEKFQFPFRKPEWEYEFVYLVSSKFLFFHKA